MDLLVALSALVTLTASARLETSVHMLVSTLSGAVQNSTNKNSYRPVVSFVITAR